MRRLISRGMPTELKLAAKEILAQTYTVRYLREKRAAHGSFSQAGEDLIVSNLIGGVNFFVDIGANDGITYSNTFYFALRGARGICFEPTRTAYAQLSSLYRLNRRVICRRCGVSNSSRRCKITSVGGLSYLSETRDPAHMSKHPVLAEHHPTEDIQLLTFEDAVSGINLPPVIDLLNVDVEGHELSVLESIPLNRYRFRAIILETHIRDDWRHRDQIEIEELLHGYGYAAICETWLNTIYCPVAELGASPFFAKQTVFPNGFYGVE